MVPVRHPVIAREGWLLLALVAGLAVAAWAVVGIGLGLPLLGVTAGLLYLFRDPARQVPAAPLGVVSPADGRVLAVDRLESSPLPGPAWRIRLRVSALGVFSLRSPIEGKIQPPADGCHVVCTDEGDPVAWAVAGHPWFAPRCYLQPGERVGQGQRCGFALLARNAEIYVPANSLVAVGPGQRVRAGESILASLVHAPGASSMGHDGTGPLLYT